MQPKPPTPASRSRKGRKGALPRARRGRGVAAWHQDLAPNGKKTPVEGRGRTRYDHEYDSRVRERACVGARSTITKGEALWRSTADSVYRSSSGPRAAKSVVRVWVFCTLQD